MERVVKRFCLQNTRDNEEIRESDFDELKLDFQAFKTEIQNDIKKTNNQTLKFASIFRDGISVLGDYIFNESESKDVDLDELKIFELYKNIAIDETGDNLDENHF